MFDAMKIKIFLALFTLVSVCALGQDKNLRAYFSYSTFAVPGSEPYIETYLAVEGMSAVFASVAPNEFQARIEISMVFSQTGKVKNFAKYELKSPIVNDVLNTNFGIIDQQRFSLPNDTYELEINIADLNNPTAIPFKTIETIQLNFIGKHVQISAIQLLENFKKSTTESIITKNGFDLVPLVFAFYPESEKQLHFYTEIYNTLDAFGDGNRYIANYYIEWHENSKLLNEFFFRKKMDSKAVGLLLNTIDITALPSGNFNLVVEVRDQQNNNIAENKIFFQRSNPNMKTSLTDITSLNTEGTFAAAISNTDSLREFLLCLAPLSTEAERDYAFNLAKSTDFKTMRQFLFHFWQNRDYNKPEQAWQYYYASVRKVNAAYKTPIKKGYATDRGRTYLKYGQPDQVSPSYNEPGAYPYEVWHYYTLGQQRNKRFVFATKDMVTNDFVLIHSDAVGELANYRWQLDIYKRTWDPNSIDDTRPDDTFGSRASDIFKNPR